MSSLAARIAEHGNRPAIVDAERVFAYADLNAASARVASALLAGRPGLNEGRVAFLIPPSFAYAATLLGIWRAGGVAVPLAVSYPPAELEYVIRDAGAEMVIADSSAAGTLLPIARNGGVSSATSDVLLSASGGSDVAHPADAVGSRRALMLYTSGTTGKPKGVVTTHANLEAQITSLIAAWEWTANDRALLVLPLHHVHGIVNVVGSALWAGAICEMAPRFESESTWDRLASGEITVFSAVPTIYHRLIESWNGAPPGIQRARSEGCRSVRLMMSGSAALPVQTLHRWQEVSSHILLERYGMTEIGMALSNPLHGERRPGFVGVPLPGVEVRLRDERGTIAATDSNPGEIEVRGPSVFLEYWRRPEETERAFNDGWFCTGDIAALEDGSYRLLGRKSIDIIKTGGYKVSALEIEAVLRDHPAIAECAVVGIVDAAWGEKVCAAVELHRDATLGLDDLRAWAKALLAPYKIPRDLRCVPALPRNAMGKVLKPRVALLFERP
jgi:malonyl-CoA/methylmalonyl-CoA synthetase